MRLEDPLYVLLTQQRGVRRGRGQIDQVPQPGRIGRRAQLEHLGIKSVGSVSNVEMMTPRALICKALFLSISTFETLPCSRAENCPWHTGCSGISSVGFL